MLNFRYLPGAITGGENWLVGYLVSLASQFHPSIYRTRAENLAAIRALGTADSKSSPGETVGVKVIAVHCVPPVVHPGRMVPVCD